MNYKTEFANNNVDLQSILDNINALPVKENIDEEIAAQDDLISQIYSALEGKTAGGSGGVELDTCTVAINCEGPTNTEIFATIVSDGSISYLKEAKSNVYYHEIENVLCGSVIVLMVKDLYHGNSVGLRHLREISEPPSILVMFYVEAGANETAVWNTVVP